MSKKTRNRLTTRRRSPYFGSISSNTPRCRICATSTAFTPRCSTVGRRSFSRTPLPHSSPAPAAPATTRTGGSPWWNKSCNATQSPLRTHGGTYQTKKITWGTRNGVWVPQSIRDAVVQFVQRWAGHTNLPILLLVGWLGIAMSKFSRWSGRLGTPNQHNASLPRDFWLEDWEKAAIIAFHVLYPLEGYQTLSEIRVTIAV